MQIERLQEENTSEWGKRERLETEKLQLERDNKRLKSIGEDLKGTLGRKYKASALDRDNELQQALQQIHQLNEVMRVYVKNNNNT